MPSVSILDVSERYWTLACYESNNVPTINDNSQELRICRLPALRALTGESRATTYQRIANGLMTKPVSLGPRAVGWPLHEINAINSAKIAGKTADEIRSLVVRLMAARKSTA